MKKYIYIVIGVFFQHLIINAQIGINTENPQSIFHIDVRKNNTGTVPSIAQQIDDAYMGLGLNDEAVLSLGIKPSGNAQLELNSANKAFYPNRVALTSQIDVVTVPNPVTGMLVWNTASVSGTNGVQPGLYVYENNKWQYVFTQDTRMLQMRYLQTAIVTPHCSASDSNCAALMNFGSDIIIPQAGAYGVGFNLYGRPNTSLAAPSREILYVWLCANGVPVDVAELNMVGFPNGGQFTYTVFLGGQFNAGDKLTCRIASYDVYHNIYLYSNPNLANSTFMLYWRLEQSSAV